MNHYPEENPIPNSCPSEQNNLSGNGKSADPAPTIGPEPVAEECSLPFRIFGVGTAGLNLLEAVLQEGADKAALVAVHSDTRALTASSVPVKVHLESRLLRGLGTAGDPERGRAAAEERLPRLKQLCEKARVVLLLAGLGGGAGTGITPVLARVAKDAGARVIVFAVLPFECEGNLRTQTASAGLHELRQLADLIICQPNQTSFAFIDESTSLVDTFKVSNALLGKSISAVWQGLCATPVMGLPFHDLVVLIQERSSQAIFVTAEATGANRADASLDRLLEHPFLGGRESLRKSEALAVVILSSPDLTMVEVNRLMERIQKETNGVPVMMGASVSSEFKDLLRIGILIAQAEAPHCEAQAQVIREPLTGGPDRGEPEMQLVDRLTTSARPASRFVPPPPPATPEKIEQVRRQRKSPSRLRQGQLPLEIVSKGRFDKSEPTIHQGEDLDIPTYIRRHVSLN